MRQQTAKIRRPAGQITLLGLAFLGLTAAAVAVAAVSGTAGDKPPSPAVASAAEVGKAFTQVTKETTPAVVFVKVERKTAAVAQLPMQGMSDPFGDDMLRKFFGDKLPQLKMPEQPQFAVGQGSGFIISPDGYILTNAHVVGGADRVQVTLADGREFDARIVGTDSRSDVAVVKVDATGLPVLPLGNSDNLEAGEWVLAVGSPFGLPGTVTSGIVSATGRNRVGINEYEDFIQTDAAINPGNSGGPLVNLRGEAVGINTAIFSRSGGYMGIGFAIPINMARQICDQLISHGSVTRGYLGVMIQELSADLAKSFGVESTEGVLIGDVTADSPAAQAGLESGDVVVRFDGKVVKDLTEFRNLVAQTSPDSQVKLEVVRDGKPFTLTATVGTLPAKDDQDGVSPDNGTLESLGLEVRTLNAELRERLGLDADTTGLVITQVTPGSKAMRAGLTPGTLVLSVNRQPVQSVEEFRRAVEAGQSQGPVLLRVRQDGNNRFVAIDLTN
ncbi:MAG: DegQ family serine endoprotease [Pirellulaceae bacterium]|nr:DegQ family serine endoprotease [Pirellulaceae bacterium]